MEIRPTVNQKDSFNNYWPSCEEKCSCFLVTQIAEYFLTWREVFCQLGCTSNHNPNILSKASVKIMMQCQHLTSHFRPLVSRALYLLTVWQMNLRQSVIILTHLIQTKGGGQDHAYRLTHGPISKSCMVSFSHLLSSWWWGKQHHGKCKETFHGVLLRTHASCSTNRTRSPISTEHAASWSKIQKVSIVHSVQIRQTQTFVQQAKNSQLNSVPFKAACSQTKPRGYETRWN